MVQLRIMILLMFILVVIVVAAQEEQQPQQQPQETFMCTRDKGYVYKEGGIFHMQSLLAHRLLDHLYGIEIGPASYMPFGLNTIHVGLTESMAPHDYKLYYEHQMDVAGCAAKIDVGREADNLYGFSDSSIPFILHSHVWEHLQNPLKALEEWVRVIENDGLLFIVVPKRDALASDAEKPLTTLDELIEWYDKPKIPLSELHDATGHLTVFSMHLLLQIMFWFNQKHYPHSSLSIVSMLETDDSIGIGHQITWRIHKQIISMPQQHRNHINVNVDGQQDHNHSKISETDFLFWKHPAL